MTSLTMFTRSAKWRCLIFLFTVCGEFAPTKVADCLWHEMKVPFCRRAAKTDLVVLRKCSLLELVSDYL